MNRRTRIVTVFLAFCFCAFAREEVTRVFDKTVALTSGQRLKIEHSLGDIDIHTHAGDDVVIHADIKVSASDANEAKSFSNNIAILVEPSSTQLFVRTRYPEKSNFGSRNISYTVRYNLTVPETAALEVKNAFGAVNATGIKAASEITTSHGNLIFRDGRGSQHLENSFGSIEVSRNTGDVAVANGNGAVTVSDITGGLTLRDRFGPVTVSRVSAAVKISNSNGTIRLTDSGAPAAVNNSFGLVSIAGVRGDLSVNNTNGKVEANNIAGSADLHTSFGAVNYSNVNGQVTVNGANSDVVGRNSGALVLQTSFGKVDVADVKGNVRIVAGNGAVTVVNASGEVNIRDGFGLVRTENTGSLNVDNANGGISSSNVRGDATVRTSFGAILLDGVSGAIDAGNQNGAIDVKSLSANGCKPISLRSSFAPIRLRLPSTASYHFSASTSFGRVTSEVPMNVSGVVSSDSLSGTIGAGKCELRIQNSNGNIDILRSGT